MRIHSDILTRSDVLTAANRAGVYFDTLTEHGSRSRTGAFEVLLRGNSRRPPQGGSSNGEKAATWDQWGVFLGTLYAKDDDMVTPYYCDSDQFHHRTDNRFDGIEDGEIPFPLDHDHNWNFAGVPRQNECTGKRGCGAVQRWDY